MGYIEFKKNSSENNGNFVISTESKISYLAYFFCSAFVFIVGIFAANKFKYEYDNVSYILEPYFNMFLTSWLVLFVILFVIFLKIKNNISIKNAKIILFLISLSSVVFYFAVILHANYVDTKKWKSFDMSYKTSSVNNINSSEKASVDIQIKGRSRQYCFSRSLLVSGCYTVDEFSNYKALLHVYNGKEDSKVELFNIDNLKDGKYGNLLTNDHNRAGIFVEHELLSSYYNKYINLQFIGGNLFVSGATNGVPLEKPFLINLQNKNIKKIDIPNESLLISLSPSGDELIYSDFDKRFYLDNLVTGVVKEITSEKIDMSNYFQIKNIK
jgi:hypothetical protein